MSPFPSFGKVMDLTGRRSTSTTKPGAGTDQINQRATGSTSTSSSGNSAFSSIPLYHDLPAPLPPIPGGPMRLPSNRDSGSGPIGAVINSDMHLGQSISAPIIGSGYNAGGMKGLGAHNSALAVGMAAGGESFGGGSNPGGGRDVSGQSVSGAEQRMMSVLIGRLNDKLPSVTCRTLATVELDASYIQLRDGLIDYSRERLSLVVHGLMGLLEPYVKQAAAASKTNPPIYILQSQVLLLRLLIDCLLSSWSHHLLTAHDPPIGLVDSLPPPRPPQMEEALAKYVLSVLTLYMRYTTYLVGGGVNASAAGTGDGKGSSGVGAFSLHRERESVAAANTQGAYQGMVPGTYATKGSGRKKMPGLSATMREIFRAKLDGNDGRDQATRSTIKLDAGPGDSPGVSTPVKKSHLAGLAGSPSTRENSRSGFINRRPSLQSLRSMASSTVTTGTKPHTAAAGTAAVSATQLILMIASKTAMVTWLLSTSNWTVVWNKLRAKIAALSSAITDEAPDAMELVLLQWCNLDQERLGQVLQELNSNFLHFKRSTQLAVGHILYETIQQWISAYPFEFVRLQTGGRRLDGNPEALFDILYGISQSSEGSKIRSALRPCEAMLLVLCPDVLSRAWESDGRGVSSMTKKTQFLEHVRKGIKSPKVDDSILKAYMEICKSALLLPANSSASLVALEQDMRADLRDKLLQGITGHSALDEDLARDGLRYLWLRQPEALLDVFRNSDRSSAAISLHLCGALVPVVDDLGKDLNFDLLSARRSELESERRIMARKQYAHHHLGPAFASILFRCDLHNGESSDIGQVEAILQLYVHDPAMAGMSIVQDKSLGASGLQSLLRKLQALLTSEVMADCRATIIEALNCVQTSIADSADPVTLHAMASIAGEMLIEGVRDFIQKFSSGGRTEDSSQFLCDQMEIKLDLLTLEHLQRYRPNRDTLLTAVSALCVQLVSSSPSIVMRTLQTLDKASKVMPVAIHNDPLVMEVARFLASLPKPDLLVSSHLVAKSIRQAWTASTPCWPLQAAYVVLHERHSALTAALVATGVAYPPATSIGRAGVTQPSWTPSQEDTELFRSVASFLAAGARCCAADWRTPLESDHLRILVPHAVANQPYNALQTYLRDTTDFLVADSAWLRNLAREALGELPATLMDTLIQHVLSVFKDNASEEGLEEGADAWTLLAAGIVSVFHALAQSPEQRCFRALVGSSSFVAAMRLLAVHLEFASGVPSIIKARRRASDIVLRAANATPIAPPGLAALADPLSRWVLLDPLGDDGLAETCSKALAALARTLKLADTDSVDALGVRLYRRKFLHLQARFALKCLIGGHQNRHPGSDVVNNTGQYFKALVSVDPVIIGPILTRLRHEEPTFVADILRLMADGLQAASPPEDKWAGAWIPPSVQCLFEDERFLQALVQTTTNQDLLARCLQSIYRAFNNAGEQPLIRSLMSMEVAALENAHGLLRSNNLTTKMLANLAHSEGRVVLRRVILPMVQALQQPPHNVQLDALETSQAANATEVAKADLARYLVANVHALLKRLLSHVADLPKVLRSALLLTAEIADRKFPGSGHTAVSAVILLRVLLPGLISPDRLNIQADMDTRRALLLVSKVINAAATGSVLRETHLAVLSGHISDIHAVMNSFLSALASGAQPTAKAQNIGSTSSAMTIRADVICLNNIIQMHAAEMRALVELKASPIYQRIHTLLDQVDPSPAPLAYRASPRQPEDRACWYEGSSTLEGKKVWYLILERLDLESDSIVDTVYASLRNAADVFHVIIDLTKLPSAKFGDYFTLLGRLLAVPTSLKALARLTIYAPPFSALELLRDIELFAASGKLVPDEAVTFAGSPSSLARLHVNLDLPMSHILEPMTDSFELEYDGIPVRVSVCDGELRLQSVLKQDIGTSNGATCELSEMHQTTALPCDMFERLSGDNLPFLRRLLAHEGLKINPPDLSRDKQRAPSDFYSTLTPELLYHMTGSINVRSEASRLLRLFQCRYLGSEPEGDPGDAMDCPVTAKDMREQAIGISKDMAATSGIPSFDFAVNLASMLGHTRGPHKQALAQCLLPWIANIAGRNRGGTLAAQKSSSLERLIHALVYGDLDDSDENSATYTPIWAELGRSGEGVIDATVNYLVELAIQVGAETSTIRRISEALGWLAPGGLLPRLTTKWRKAIVGSGQVAVDSLVDSDEWMAIAGIGNILQILLEDTSVALDVVIALPDLMYGIAVTMRLGDLQAKQRAYSTWRAVTRLAEGLESVSFADGAIGEDREQARHAFQVSKAGTQIGDVADKDTVRKDMSDAAAVELALNRLLDIVDRSASANQWTSRLMSYLTASAFQRGPTRNRAVLSLKVLIGRGSGKALDDDLVYQTVFIAADSLSRGKHAVHDLEGIEGMIDCLSVMIGTPRFGPSVAFWSGVALLQASCVRLAPCALNLVSCALTKLQKASRSGGSSTFVALFAGTEEENLALQEETGLAMDSPVKTAFVLAALLLRCLEVPDLCTAAEKILSVLLEMGQDGPEECLMPFLLVRGLRGVVKKDEGGTEAGVRLAQLFSNSTFECSIMGLAIMLGYLQAVTSDADRVILIRSIMSVQTSSSPAPSLIAWLPDISAIVLEYLSQTEDPNLMAAVMELIAMDSRTSGKRVAGSATGGELLEDLGMTGLEIITFGPQTEERVGALMQLAAESFVRLG